MGESAESYPQSSPDAPQKASNELSIEEKKIIAETLPLVLGENFDFTVVIGPPGSGSHWAPNERIIQYDGEILNDPIDVACGVIEHEAGHEYASDLVPFKSIWNMLGANFGINAVEDPRANQNMMLANPGTRPHMRAYIEKDLSPGGGLDYKNIKKDAEGKLGYVPKYMKAGAEYIRLWYEINFAQSIPDPSVDQSGYDAGIKKFLDAIPKEDHDVRDTIEATIQPFVEYYQTLRQPGESKQRAAREAADIYIKKIWPTYKKLVDASLKDQSMIDWLKDQMKQKGDQGKPQQGGGGGQGGQPMMIPFDSLPEEIKDEIRQKMQEQAEKNKSGKKEQNNNKGQEQQSGGQPQNGDKGDQQGDKQGDSGGGQSGEGDQEGSEGKEGGEKRSGGGQGGGKEQKGEEKEGEGSEDGQIPWDKLSEKAKKEIEKVFDGKNDKGPKTSQQDRDKASENAQKDLEDLEDKQNEKLQGKMVDPEGKPETHAEKREKAEEQKKEQEKKDATKNVTNMEKKQKSAIDELPDNPYQEFLIDSEVDNVIQVWKTQLRKLFMPTTDPRKKLSATGVKLNMQAAYKRAADRRVDKIWEVKGALRAQDYRFTLLVDLSESMTHDGKIAETFKAVVALAEILNTFNIEFEIIGFTDSLPDNVKVYKSFENKKLSYDIRQEIGQLFNDCMTQGSGTPTYEATEYAEKSMLEYIKRRASTNNYLMTITDGACNSTSKERMKEFIREITMRKKILPVGLGIGPDTDFVKDSYPELPLRVREEVGSLLGKSESDISGSFSDITTFSKAFKVIIDNMIRHPEYFFK